MALAVADCFVRSDGSNYDKLLLIANSLLILSALMMVVSITMSFVFPHYFTISVQVVAHIVTIVFAGVLKVAYVLRCIGRKGLGQEV